MTSPYRILRIGLCGTPRQWLRPIEAAALLVKSQVVWSLGEDAVVLRGGINAQGERSQLPIPAIIATRGKAGAVGFHPTLTNSVLFARDRYICLYCGQRFPAFKLSRDHVVPRGQGGADNWENVVTACRRCNQRKGCRTPEQAAMPLLAVPYRPNVYEFAVLANRHIVADQMAFLANGLSDKFHRSY